MPAAIGGGDGGGAVQFDSGNSLTCAVFPRGAVRCTGRGTEGELGTGVLGDVSTMTADVDFPLPASAVAVGERHACARWADGAVRCWGAVDDGRLGAETLSDVAAPLEAPVAFGGDGSGEMYAVVDVSAHAAHTCARFASGALRCWGANGSGQLGQGNSEDVGDALGELALLQPIDLGVLDAPIRKVTGGDGFTCVLSTKGAVVCWGTNADSQLGTDATEPQGDDNGEMGQLEAIDFGTDLEVTDMDSGADSSCALFTDRIKCWGNGADFKLGQGNQDDLGPDLATAPMLDFGAAAYTPRAISVGLDVACVVLEADDDTSDDGIKCWGLNDIGQFGIGAGGNFSPATVPFTNLAAGTAPPVGEVHCIGRLIVLAADWTTHILRPGCTHITSPLVLALVDAETLPSSAVVAIDGSLTIASATLVDITDAFPLLDYVSGSVSVSASPNFAHLVLPAVTAIDASLVASRADDLVSIDMPLLASTNAIYLVGNPALSVVSLPSLVDILGAIDTDSLLAEENAVLKTLELPKLANVANNLRILDAPRLQSVAIGSDESVTTFSAAVVRFESAGSLGVVAGLDSSFYSATITSFVLQDVNTPRSLDLHFDTLASFSLVGQVTASVVSVTVNSGDVQVHAAAAAHVVHLTVSGNSFSTVDVDSCPLLESLHLLVGTSSSTSISVQNNPLLTVLTAPSLTSGNTIVLDDNNELCCSDKDWLLGLSGATSSGNNACSSDTCDACPTGHAGPDCSSCAFACASGACTNDGNRLDTTIVCEADCEANRLFLGDRFGESLAIGQHSTIASLSTEALHLAGGAAACATLADTGRTTVMDGALFRCNGFSWADANATATFSSTLWPTRIVQHASAGGLEKNGFNLLGDTESLRVAGRIGDLDGNLVPDLAVQLEANAVGIVLLSADGTVLSGHRIDATSGDLPTLVLSNFGDALFMAPVGDQDGDGVGDIVATVPGLSALAMLFMTASGRVRAHVLIDLPDGTDSDSGFGSSVDAIGDVNGDGSVDLIAGLVGNEEAIVLLMSPTNPGAVLSAITITSPSSNGAFGAGVAGLGDVNGDDIPDVAVGDSDQVIVVFLGADGAARSANAVIDSTSFSEDTIVGAGDVNGDGVPDFAIGRPELASTNRDQIGGYAWVLLNADGTMQAAIPIGHDDVNPAARTLDRFGASMTVVGDIDGNGLTDLAVCSPGMLGGLGALVLSFTGEAVKCGDGVLNAGEACDDGNTMSHDGCSKTCALEHLDTFSYSHSFSSDTSLLGTMPYANLFGIDMTSIQGPDVNGDGIADLALGTWTERFFVALLDVDGRITSLEEAVNTDVPNGGNEFGSALGSLGDVNNDGIGDIAVGAYQGGTTGSGAVWVAQLNSDGSVGNYGAEIGPAFGPFAAYASKIVNFGRSLTLIGDVDGDGIDDMAIGDDLYDGGRGAVFIAFMNDNMYPASTVVLTTGENGLPADFPSADGGFGMVTAMGDIDLDGVPDLAVGAYLENTDTVPDAGQVAVMLLNGDGSSKDLLLITPPTAEFEGRFGVSVSGRADFDGDGVRDLLVGAAKAPIGVESGRLLLFRISRDLQVSGWEKLSIPHVPTGESTQFGRQVETVKNPDGSHMLFVSATHTGRVNALEGLISVTRVTSSGCGDGTVDEGEACDDGNADPTDFCSTACTVNPPTSVEHTGALALRFSQLGLVFGDNDMVGMSLATLANPDVNGDGISDLAIGTGGDFAILSFLDNGGAASSSAIDYRMLTAAEAGGAFGEAVASLGDWDGNGVHDIVIGQPGSTTGGSVHIVLLGPGASLVNDLSVADDGSPSWFSDLALGENPVAFGSAIVSLGDVDGDGLNDIAVSDPLALDGLGLVHLIAVKYAPIGTSLTTSNLGTIRTSDFVPANAEAASFRFGAVLAVRGGANADGGFQLLSTVSDTLGAEPSEIAVVTVADGVVSHAETISATSFGFQSIRGVAAAGDLDGDGRVDIVLNAASALPPSQETFAVYLTDSGALRDSVALHSTNLRRKKDDGSIGSSLALIDDISGDGYPELVVGGPLDDTLGSDAGIIWMYALQSNRCGNGVIEDGEVCDDGNFASGDGCSSVCHGERLFSNFHTVLPLSSERNMPLVTGGAVSFVGRSLAGLFDPDVDGDGVPDVAFGSYQTSQAHLLLLNPDGTGKKVIEYAAGDFSGATAWFGIDIDGVGDFDRDGVHDLVIFDSSVAAFFILLLNTDGSVKADSGMVAPGTAPYDLTGYSTIYGYSGSGAGDVNGDGVPDIFVADPHYNSNEGRVTIVFMNSDMTVLDFANISPSVSGSNLQYGGNALLSHDFNGDGTPDLVSPAFDTNGKFVDIVLLTKSGTVLEYINIDFDVQGRYGFVTDLDGDGGADLVFNDPYGELTLPVFLNSDGTLKELGEPLPITFFGSPTMSIGLSDIVSIGDVDGDGRNDVALSGSGGFHVALTGPETCGNGVVEADEACDDGNMSNDDGCSTTCHINSVDGFTAIVKLAHETNGLGSIGSSDRLGGNLVSLAEPDVNGDGRTDIAIGSDDGFHVCLLDASGAASACSHTPASAEASISSFGLKLASLGDYNQDGIADLVVAGNGNGFVIAYLDSNGAAALSKVLFSTTTASSLAVAGDLNGDGRPEIVLSDPLSDPGCGTNCGEVTIVFLGPDLQVESTTVLSDGNNGIPSGMLSANSWFSVEDGIGDLNGDGIPDIVYNTRTPSATGVLFLNTDGTVQSLSAITPDPELVPDTSGAKFATGGFCHSDVDGDGVVDVMIPMRKFQGVALAFMNTDGTAKSFRIISSDDAAATDEANSDFGGACAMLGDVDGDGFPDLAIAARGASSDQGAVFVMMQTSLNLCGNGVVDDGEMCDAGADVDDATCTAQCTSRLPFVTASVTSLSLIDVLGSDTYFGSSMSIFRNPDINGDDVPDLWLATYQTGNGHVAMLNDDGTVMSVSLADGTALFDPDPLPSTVDGFGWDSRALGDFNGDGVNDVVAYDTTTVYLCYMTATGEYDSKDSVVASFASASLSAVSGIGDLNKDGVLDIAVGVQDDPTCSAGTCGSIEIVFLNSDATIQSTQQITEGVGGFTGVLAHNAVFGARTITVIGDVNGDNVQDIAVSAFGAKEAWLLLLGANGQCVGDVRFGRDEVGAPSDVVLGVGITGIGDVDGDGVPDLVIGGPDSALDGHIYLVTLHSDGSIKSTVRTANEQFGPYVGNCGRQLESFDMGADFTTLFVGCEGTVVQNENEGSVEAVRYDRSACGNGVLDAGEECDDGSREANDFCSPLCTLEPVNKVKSANKIARLDLTTHTSGGTGGFLRHGVISDPDANGDGIQDLVVGTWEGYAIVVNLNRDGTVHSDKQIATSDMDNGTPGANFGFLAGPLHSDVDGNNRGDVFVGSYSTRQLWLVSLDTDGSVLSTGPEIASGFGPLTGLPTSGRWLHVMSLGDMDGDSYAEVAVSAPDTATGTGTCLTACGSLVILFTDASMDVDHFVVISQDTTSMPTGFPASNDNFPGGFAHLEHLTTDTTFAIASIAGSRFDILYLSRDDGSVQNVVSTVEDTVGSKYVDLDGDGVPEVLRNLIETASPSYSVGAQIIYPSDGTYTALKKRTILSPAKQTEMRQGYAAFQGDIWRNLGDLNLDGFPDLVGNAIWDSRDGATDRGSMHILFMASDLCGDGIVQSNEECDDGNFVETDACSNVCEANPSNVWNTPLELSANTASFPGSSDSQLGYAVAGLFSPDVNGDGVPDVAVSSAGMLHVVSMEIGGGILSSQGHGYQAGRFEAGVTDAQGTISALAAAGDVDGNGAHDVVLGDVALGSIGGVVFVMLASDASIIGTRVLVPGATSNLPTMGMSVFGSDVGVVGNIDSFGSVDIVVSDATTGAVVLILCAGDLGVVGVRVFGNGDAAADLDFGIGVSLSATGAGDVDGDGNFDIAVASGATSSIYILFLDEDFSVASFRKTGLDGGEDFGRDVVAVSGPGQGLGHGLAVGSSSGARVFAIDQNGYAYLRDTFETSGHASFTVSGAPGCGTAVAAAGPVTGDGAIDLWIGCPFDDADSVGDGSLWLMDLATNQCGNGLLENSEVCDDGNRINGDGCSSTCTKDHPCDVHGAGLCFRAHDMERIDIVVDIISYPDSVIPAYVGPTLAVDPVDRGLFKVLTDQANGQMCLDFDHQGGLDTTSGVQLFNPANSGAVVFVVYHPNVAYDFTFQTLVNFPFYSTGDEFYELTLNQHSLGEMGVNRRLSSPHLGQESMSGQTAIPTNAGPAGVSVVSWTMHAKLPAEKTRITFRGAIDGGPMRDLGSVEDPDGGMSTTQNTDSVMVTIGARRSGGAGSWPGSPPGSSAGIDGCVYETHVYPKELDSTERSEVEQYLMNKYFPDAFHVCGDGIVEGTEACDNGPDVEYDGCNERCELDWGCASLPEFDAIVNVHGIDFTVAGSSDDFGFQLAAAGDINGDGIGDFITSGRTNDKQFYVGFMSATGAISKTQLLDDNDLAGVFDDDIKWVVPLGRHHDSHLTDILVITGSDTYYPLSLGPDGNIVIEHSTYSQSLSPLSGSSAPENVPSTERKLSYPGCAGAGAVVDMVYVSNAEECVHIVAFDANLAPVSRKELCAAEASAAGFASKWGPATGPGRFSSATIVGDIDGNGTPDILVNQDVDDLTTNNESTALLVFLDAAGDIVDIYVYSLTQDTFPAHHSTSQHRLGEGAVAFSAPPSGQDGGLRHLVLGAWRHDLTGGATEAGAVHQVCIDGTGKIYGHTRETSETLDLDNLAFSDQSLGKHIVNLGDINGDGTEDLLLTRFGFAEVIVLLMHPRGNEVVP